MLYGELNADVAAAEGVPILINGEFGLNSEGKPNANLLLLGPPWGLERPRSATLLRTICLAVTSSFDSI